MILSCQGEVTQLADRRGGYVTTCDQPWLLLTDPQPFFPTISIADAELLIGATALVFVTAFVMRLIFRQLNL